MWTVETWLRDHQRLALGLIFVAAFLLRLAVSLTYQGGLQRALAGDEPLFEDFALGLLRRFGGYIPGARENVVDLMHGDFIGIHPCRHLCRGRFLLLAAATSRC